MEKKLTEMNELVTNIISEMSEVPEDSELTYEVWALGYDEDITEVEILLGSFEDPDVAVQYASIVQLADIEEVIRENYLDEYMLDGLTYLSIEVETVIACEDDDSTMNVGTVYNRTIQLKTDEDLCITSADYEVLETGELKVAKKLLADYNKNDCIKVLFADKENKPILTYKIISKVIYEDGEYYHLEFIY
jgi:hypothetical protein